MQNSRFRKLLLILLTSFYALNAKSQTSIKPQDPRPEWAPDIKPEMEAVIEKLESFNAKPITELNAKEARKNPTPTTAVMAIIKEKNIVVSPSMVDTSGKGIAVAGGKIHLRINTPKNASSSLPIIVYYHGGGWVIADLDTYDASAKGLSEQVGAIVISVAYRQAPEHKFPTAHNDSYTAYEWALKNAASLKGDPKNVAVAGESAGGNLAAAVCMMARDKGAQLPVHQLLIYPIAGYDFTTPSYQKYALAKPLNKEMMQWFFEKYLRTPEDGMSPWISFSEWKSKWPAGRNNY